jgi:hypothetical protein
VVAEKDLHMKVIRKLQSKRFTMPMMFALGGWLLVWSGLTLWTELTALISFAPLVELQAGAASGLPAALSLIGLAVAMTARPSGTRWQRLGMAVAIGALPLVLVLPAAMLFGGTSYLSGKGYVDCPDQLGSQRFPVIRKVRPQAQALCTKDGSAR